MPNQAYQEEYEGFLKEYTSGSTTGERVGEVIAHMAQHFTTANIEYAISLKAYNRIVSQIEGTVDDESRKTISSTKAKSLANATPESDALIDTKAHIENIEQIINALKSLQKGVLQEYSHTSQM